MAQEIFTGPFHRVGRDPPRFIKYADGTFLAKTFPVQDPALHGSKDYKEYFVKLESNVYLCLLCDMKAKDSWGSQSHMMHHHPYLCNLKELEINCKPWVARLTSEWIHALEISIGDGTPSAAQETAAQQTGLRRHFSPAPKTAPSRDERQHKAWLQVNAEAIALSFLPYTFSGSQGIKLFFM